MTPEHLKDFDALSGHVLKLLQHEFGFASPMLFMHDPLEKRLCSELTQQQFALPVTETPSGLSRAFAEQQIVTTSSLKELFEGEQPDPQQETKNRFVALPVVVGSHSVGVFALGVKHQEDLTELERVFLRHFSDQVAVQLATAWMLKHSMQANKRLEEMNQDYRHLIEVKRTFLEQIHDVLLECVNRPDLEERQKEKIVSSLAYLHSVLLLSQKTVEDDTAYGTAPNSASGEM